MNLLVFSDSHGDTNTMRAVASMVKPDAIAHLGDHMLDALELFREFPDTDTHAILGNTDSSSIAGDDKVIVFEGKRILLTHGHNYGVEYGLGEIAEKALSSGVEIALFGHTHMPHVSYSRGVWLVNPGRVGVKPGSSIHATYGILSVDGGAISCKICAVA